MKGYREFWRLYSGIKFNLIHNGYVMDVNEFFCYFTERYLHFLYPVEGAVSRQSVSAGNQKASPAFFVWAAMSFASRGNFAKAT